jgi:phage-related protein
MGTLTGMAHTSVVCSRPNPAYFYSLENQVKAQADKCEKLADDCTTRAASMQAVAARR